jgi:hypothetical protein
VSHSLQFLKFDLYSGADIANALENSQATLAAPLQSRSDRFERVMNLAGELRSARFIPRHCVITGREQDSGEAMTVMFSGSLRATNRRARDIIGNADITSREVRTIAGVTPDILVTDHPWARPWMRWKKSLRIPKWVRQELPVAATWDATVAAIPKKLREDIARLLRKFEYRVCIDERIDALSDFYRELHLPYVQSRFEEDALVVDEATFLRETRATTRLNLIHNNEIVAASLIERDDDRLLISRSSMAAGVSLLRGRSDILDYFCLLLAQLTGCTILDFGRSRPYILDGSLRYKAKWRTRIVPSGGSEPATCISPIKRSPATLAFLRRNYFIQQADKTSYIRILYDQDSPADTIASLAEKTRNLGLTEVRLACREDFESCRSSSPLPSNFRIERLSNARDPLHQLLKQS